MKHEAGWKALCRVDSHDFISGEEANQICGLFEGCPAISTITITAILVGLLARNEVVRVNPT